MRKKILVLLLAVSLVLSFMPMIVFADTEAEGFEPVNETVEAEEPVQDDMEVEEAEAPAAEAASDEESAEVVSQLTVAGQQALNAEPECAHEETYPYTSWDDEESLEYNIIEEDNRCHTVTGIGEKGTRCELCGELFDSFHGLIEEEEEHEYEDGVCILCGYENTCAHKNKYTESERDWDSATYSPIDDNKFHIVTGPVEKTTWCEDCGEAVSVDTVVEEDNDYHDYDSNNVCGKCEHPNSCEHKHKEYSYDWERDDVNFKSENNAYHSVTGSGERSAWCEDCWELLGSEDVDTFHDEEHHNYNSEHVCIDCGHKNTCNHSRAYTFYDWDRDDVRCKPVAVDNTYHKVTGPGELSMWCEYCGETFKREKVDNVNAEEYHDYNSENVCVDCDHINTCSHPSKPYYEYVFDSDRCIIVDTGNGSQHKVTGRITKYTYCKTCEGLIEKKDLDYETVKEIHYYEDGVCRYCGYQKPDIRLYGNARYDTAIEAAEKFKGSANMFENVIVAYGRNFPDALSGGYLAKVRNAPILLVEPSQENRIVDYISSRIASGGTVYILGGTGVVSSAFEEKVNAEGINTKRLGGSSRYETNLFILDEAEITDQELLVCTGKGYADSLSASAVGKPILLVGDALTEMQKNFLYGLSKKQIYLIGGTGAVGSAIEKELKNLKFEPERIAGQSRYETSAAVAGKFFARTTTALLAYAKNFPDGLSGGPLAIMKNAPIVLTDSKNYAAAKDYVNSAKVVESITLGGPALISDIAVKTIMGR